MSSLDGEIWEILDKERPQSDAMVARLIYSELSDALFAAVDSAGGRHFLIPLLANEKPLYDDRSRGLRVNTEELHVRGGMGVSSVSRYIDVSCQDKAALEGFDIIGRQIAVSLSRENGSKAEIIARILSKWRYFWGQSHKNILSPNEIIGLFAELWFLLNWVLPYSDHDSAISSWRGPYGSRHDFEWPSRSVEVKGTTTVEGRKHWIHGIEQLSPPERGDLFLFSLRLRIENGADNTLPQLIESCRDHFREDLYALERFEETLTMVGYSQIFDEEYGKTHFRVVDGVLYRVYGSFPRITRESVKEGTLNGVSTIEYEISLDGFDDYIVSKTPQSNIFENYKK